MIFDLLEDLLLPTHTSAFNLSLLMELTGADDTATNRNASCRWMVLLFQWAAPRSSMTVLFIGSCWVLVTVCTEI